jgi:hypothetical protein
MERDETGDRQTEHALLVVWGEFARQIGLVEAIDRLPLAQRRRVHTPQTKVLEFLVAQLGGLKYLQDISQAEYPLDQDREVALAWGRDAWADYSGVSRTLSHLLEAEADQIMAALDQVSQVFFDREINLALTCEGRLVLDGDLTGLPVCKGSKSYPQTAFGHMDDCIKLGYQASLVSMQSLTYGRLWLSVEHRPGNTVSATEAEAMLQRAEARTGVRPWRRTDLLVQRIEQVAQQRLKLQEKRAARELKVAQAQAAIQQVEQDLRLQQDCVTELERLFGEQACLERPHSRLAKARKRVMILQDRLVRRQAALDKARKVLERTDELLAQHQPEEERLRERHARFLQENATNPHPAQIVFRLDAGFGTYENLALLIEMGYEVYTKLHNQQVVRNLRKQIPAQAVWRKVATGVSMIFCSSTALEAFPYQLDVGLEHFARESKTKYSALLHFGTDRVAQDLAGWFTFYNHRQTIEAGIKESKQVFYLNRLKVRSLPAIRLQEYFVILAANLIRWANDWIYHQVPAAPSAFPKLSIKKLVQVGAYTSASVISTSKGKLLKFSDRSVFKGKELLIPRYAEQLPLPAFKNYFFPRV